MPQIETTGEAQSNVSSTDGVPVTGGRFQVSSVDHTPKNSTAVICGDIRNTNNTVILLQDKDGGENVPLCGKNDDLALYEDEYNTQGQKIGHMLRSLSLYNAVLPASQKEDDIESTGAVKHSATVGAKMGTIIGVYLPCLQNIFGVLFFIRLSWIVGNAGIFGAFFVVFICCSVTFLTSISLSAIATNGVVPSGGPYYMISRNLGPELGGAIGFLFYLGTTVAGSMYVTGAVEIFLLYLIPEAKIFDDMYNNFRLLGTILLIIIGLIVLAGVKVVNKFALPCVLVVIACIFCTFIGGFVKSNGYQDLKYCMVGDRIVNLVKISEQLGKIPECTPDGLKEAFCPLNNTKGCDAYFDVMYTSGRNPFNNQSSIREELAIPGLFSGVIFKNFWPKYQKVGDVITRDSSRGNSGTNAEKSPYAFADVTTGFMMLIGVFFPSATGIMAGSNRSGNLKDASKSIPLGTLGAQLSTSFVYLSGVILIGGSVSDMFLRDKFGASAMGKLTIAELAVPHRMFILIGCFLSTVGAGMQSLTGAPRLLQAIAADDVIPFLRKFQYTDKRGEPLLAILLTLIICECGILIAVIENITALITQFFLMCYLGINAACALQSIMKAPGWRPSFKYFHWTLSSIGAALCIAVMFISAWYFALFAIVIGAAIYKYIEYAGAEKEWGDGLKGLALSGARFALLNLEAKTNIHTKNWRPQLLVLFPSSGKSAGAQPKSDEDINETSDCRKGLLSFVSQLKAGKGLTMVAECIQGDFAKNYSLAENQKEIIHNLMKQHKIKGFNDVVVSKDYMEGISSLIQTAGLGGLRHNTIVIQWPTHWSDPSNLDDSANFVNTLRHASAGKCAVLVPKNVHLFPSSSERINGFIDVWWVVHDGGLLLLLSFLLRKNKVWKNTKIRLFTVANVDDNTVQMKKDLEKFLYHLRIDAQICVVEMPESDISEYVYERTLKMEERHKMIRNLQIKEKRVDIQSTMDDVVRERKMSKIVTDEDIATKLDKVQKHNIRGVRFSENDEICNKEEDVKKVTIELEPTPRNSPTKITEDWSNKIIKMKNYNVRKMHNALNLNQFMKSQSSEAQLIIVNLPGLPESGLDTFYMEFIEALTEGLDRILLVRGSGTEVITIYS
ncbi:K-Cl co-transporter family and Amino acid permease/ SLC12A domain-containing protein [Strongyloides ratti]|uniref:K-Cl co-transporter family and Amino acid permease/ SLC12A domain-containing protein n=1 Tax=Strongyloides ratti TaxID=34506 RepID=A0A090MT00_STRRB|nr:K-Cl co-transporter family and Amino acid permease/ SLC12A domain-containing protein [Strongyloides ratti]CEF61443.1 K-Cl co-transporter family and Amino acid permease/ SLC12A domain-containing protein [Strongyloides ratti]